MDKSMFNCSLTTKTILSPDSDLSCERRHLDSDLNLNTINTDYSISADLSFRNRIDLGYMDSTIFQYFKILVTSYE